jgi:hypothetical protein
MISLASYPTRKKSLIDDQLYGQIDKAVSIKPTRKVTTTPISLHRKIALQHEKPVEMQLPTANTMKYEYIEDDEKEISKLGESIAGSAPDDFLEGHSPNIAARSAMFEFLSDKVYNLILHQLRARSFGLLNV